MCCFLHCFQVLEDLKTLGKTFKPGTQFTVSAKLLAKGPIADDEATQPSQPAIAVDAVDAEVVDVEEARSPVSDP